MINRRTFSAAAMAVPLASQLWLPAFAQAAAAVGQPAPDFTAVDTAGKTHKLSDFKGKFVVLEWTNPGCPFVRKHYSGNMQATQKEAVGKGAVWLAINSTEGASADYLAPAKLAGWMAEKQAAPTATLMDASGKIGQLYGARTTPHLYIVNPQGQLVYAGAIDSIASARVDDIRTATNYIRQGLAEGLAGKPLSVATSRAYGCSIKYKA
ncbi:MAG: redoxin domain-containing protein [Comamonadaceae bacterium]|nr:MAG: redoxin domain-containing protein [Comamonadaceae bacterium]